MKTTNMISIGGVKIVIGNNSCSELGNELLAKKCHKPLVITDKGIEACGLLEEIVKSIKKANIDYVIYNDIPSDPPSSVVKQGTELLVNENCDSVVAVGGGSVMDAAKAINIMSTNEGSILDYDNSAKGGKKFQNDGKPLFSIPTTSGTGSEVTQYAVITSEEEQRKATIGDERLTSKVVFLDPLMTIGLPASITAATGIDALAHAIEAYTSNRVITAAGSTVFSDTLAIKAVEYIAKDLKKAYTCGMNVEARKNVMLGSTLAGLITQAGSGGGHGLGTPLGAHFHVPHGISVGIMLPYVMEYSLDACPERYQNIAVAMGCNIEGLTLKEAAFEAVIAVRELLTSMNFPVLKDYVEKEEDLEMLAQDAQYDKCCQLNARIIDLEAARLLYKRAWK